MWVTAAGRTNTSSAATTFTMTFADIATHAPNGGVQASLCIFGTPVSDCIASNPGNNVDAQGTADANGTVVLNVTFANEDGYIGFVHVVDPSNKMLDDVVEVNFVQDLHLKTDTFTRADVTARLLGRVPRHERALRDHRCRLVERGRHDGRWHLSRSEDRRGHDHPLPPDRLTGAR
jgi:hypothetical protein